MVKVKVAKLTDVTEKKNTKRELYAQVAYYYPQYSLKSASELKFRDLKLLLEVAQKQKSIDYLNLTQIIAAPHSKNGTAVKKLLKSYDEVIKS